MKLDRRDEGDASGCRRQRPDRGEAIARRVVDTRTTPDSPSRRERVRTGRQPAAAFGRIDGDAPPVAVDQHRLGEPLLGMSAKDAAKDLRRRRLRGCGKRSVETPGEKGRAQVDLACGLRQREIPLEPQMLQRHDDHERRPWRRGQSMRPRATQRPPRAHAARCAAFAASPDAFCPDKPPHLPRSHASLSLPDLAKCNLRATPPSTRITTIRILVQIFVQPLDRSRTRFS